MQSNAKRFLITLLSIFRAGVFFSLRVGVVLTLAWGGATRFSLPAHAACTRAAIAPQAQTPPRFERISGEDGPSLVSVPAILQDQWGFMWFGTEAGLFKYDGYQFTAYKHIPGDPRSLADNSVRTLREDQDGALWVGTMRGLQRLDRATGEFVRYQHDPSDPTSLSDGGVLSLHEDRGGALWVGTASGWLDRFDRATQTFAHFDLFGQISEIYEDRDGDLWVGTWGGLYRFDRATESFSLYRHDPEDPASLSHNAVQAIFEDSQRNLWIGTDGGGLNRLDRSLATSSGKQLGFVHYRQPAGLGVGQIPGEAEGARDGLRDDRVTAVLEDSAGRLWVGTEGGGLSQLDREHTRFTHHANSPIDPHSLSDDRVISLYEDRSGVLWIGTLGGVNKLNPTAGRFAHYQRRMDLPAPSKSAEMTAPYILSDDLVTAVYEDRDGALWVGTSEGGLNRLDRDSGRVTVYQSNPGDPGSLSDNYVGAIFQDNDGQMWIGTDLGLALFSPEDGIFRRHPEVRETRVTAIQGDRSGDLWVGTYTGLYRLGQPGGPVKVYRHRPDDPTSLAQDLVWTTHQDRTGALWVGTLGGGISLWDGDRFTQYAHDPDDPRSLSHDEVLFFHEDSAGMMWVGTRGGGLNRFDRSTDTFSRYAERDGLAGDIVSCILSDSAGFLWLGTEKGLSRFDPRTGAFRNFDERDGLQSGALTSCFQNARGEMFFGGVHGLNTFFPAAFRDNPHAPPIVITAFFKFNQKVRADLPLGEHIQLSYRENFISFEFAALDFNAPAKNQYAYLMEGLDQDWAYIGTRRHVDFTDLRPGDYVFRVKGSNNDGVWNEAGVTVRITVAPPVWDMWWFRGGSLLVLLAVIASGFRLRVRGIQARSRQLERQVEQRTHEIEQRRQVAEGLRDIVAVLNSDRPLDEILDYIVVQAGRLLGSEAAVLHHIEYGRDFVAVRASVGLPRELAEMEGFPLHATPADATILSRQPYIRRDFHAPAAESDDATRHPRAERWLTVVGQHYRASMAVPLIVADEVYGAIAFYYAEPRPFPQEQVDLAVAFADQAALAIENARLRAQAQEAAVEAERGRLARDMHDSVTQSLFSLTLLSEAGERLIKTRDLDQVEENQVLVSQIARQALQEMRLMVYELRPPAVGAQGLVAALEHRLEAVERRAGVDARLVVEGDPDLPPDEEEELYRIAHEALNNALKHASASAVMVTIRDADSTVMLEIVDDGKGFDLQIARGGGGLGLVSMQERAKNVGARLIIHSAPDEGTRVEVSR